MNYLKSLIKPAIRNLIDSGKVSKMSVMDEDLGFRKDTLSDMLNNTNDKRKQITLAQLQSILRYIMEKDYSEGIKLIRNITGIHELVTKEKCEWELYQKIGKMIDMGL